MLAHLKMCYVVTTMHVVHVVTTIHVVIVVLSPPDPGNPGRWFDGGRYSPGLGGQGILQHTQGYEQVSRQCTELHYHLEQLHGTLPQERTSKMGFYCFPTVLLPKRYAKIFRLAKNKAN